MWNLFKRSRLSTIIKTNVIFSYPLVLPLVYPGLPREHFPAAALERPEVAPADRLQVRRSDGGPQNVPVPVEAWSVLRQREERQLPRRHTGEHPAVHLPQRGRAHQHEVNSPGFIVTDFLLLTHECSACINLGVSYANQMYIEGKLRHVSRHGNMKD